MDFFPSFTGRVQLNMYTKTSRTSYNRKRRKSSTGERNLHLGLLRLKRRHASQQRELVQEGVLKLPELTQCICIWNK